LKPLGIPLAAKTGTVQLPDTQEFRKIDGTKDTWIAVYNPDYVVTVWLGFDETTSQNYLPANAVGGSFTADISREILQHIYKNRKAKNFEKPLNVLEVELDAKALNERHQALLASPLTPQDQIVLEYFTRGNVPRQETDYWVIPDPPKDFEITIAPSGFPTISFTSTQSFAVYDIYRASRGMEAIPVQRLKQGNQPRLQWTDTSVKPNETYSYYVIATHPEITMDGVHVQSLPTPVLTLTIPNIGHTDTIDGQQTEDTRQDNQAEENNVISIQIP
jgi:membrane peptidoglycan carboxypeptidase